MHSEHTHHGRLLLLCWLISWWRMHTAATTLPAEHAGSLRGGTACMGDSCLADFCLCASSAGPSCHQVSALLPARTGCRAPRSTSAVRLPRISCDLLAICGGVALPMPRTGVQPSRQLFTSRLDI